MKLLYVWIEEFRNIRNQGIVVDNEFSISVTDSHNSSFDYYTDDGSRIIPTEGTPKYGRKIFTRKISWLKNDDYPTCKVECAIDSISALVGKNAVGKSSILDCLSSQEHEYLRIDTRYYFLAYLNRSEHCIEIRSKGIRIISEDVIFLDSYKTTGYETYIIPLENFSPTYPCISDEQTTFYFLISQKKASSYVGYTVLGMPTIVGDLDAFNNYKAFEGAFDFLCHFPTLVSSGNKLAVFLDSADRNQHNDYFEKANLTCAEYKNFYIQRLAQILFSNLRTYLYHPQPVFMMSGRREKLPNEDVLIEEDKRCAQLLAIFNGLYPHEGVADLISSKTNRIPQAEIREVLNFFSNSTYSFNGKFAYDEYLKNISQLFEALFVADDKLFPAIFKLELPFQSQYEPIVSALQKCVNTSDILNENWANGLNIRFEWFSSGEFHLSMLFSAIYQRMKETDGDTSNRDVIWAIDEPEMHMHPELGRSFIDELNRAMRQFKDIGLFRTCQFIFATHSPFLIQSLGQYTSTLTLVEKDNNQIFAKAFDNIPQLRFPGRTELSFNLIMFKIFGVPTVELHNELYGILQEHSQCFTEKDFEQWLANKGVPRNKQWIRVNKGQPQAPYPVTLETYIRNSIHHPENRSNSYQYSTIDLQMSIDEMLALLFGAK